MNEDNLNFIKEVSKNGDVGNFWRVIQVCTMYLILTSHHEKMCLVALKRTTMLVCFSKVLFCCEEKLI